MVTRMRHLSFRRHLFVLLFSLLSFSCVAPHHAHRPAADGPDLRRIDRDPELIDGYDDGALARSLRKAEVEGVWQGEGGARLRSRLNTLLATRCRSQYPFIPDQLWGQLQGADWTGLFMEQPVGVGEGEVGAAILPLPGAEPFGAEESPPGPPGISYAIEGGVVRLAAAAVAVGGIPMTFPELSYIPPQGDEDILQTTERILSQRHGQAVHLGAPLGSGNMRAVYHHPADREKIVKVYLPTKMRKIYDDGGFKFPAAAFAASFLQRDLAMEGFLKDLRQSYLDRGLKPPFDLATIDASPELISRGIIVQQRVKGLQVWNELPAHLTRQRLFNLNRFFRVHRLFDRKLYELIGARYGIYLVVRATVGSEPREIGIDWGERFTNFFVADDGTPILMDW